MHRRTILPLVLLAIGTLGASCGPAQPVNQDGATGPCQETTCYQSCLQIGYSGGGCVGTTCHCTGVDPDGSLPGTLVTGQVWSPGGLVGISGALVHFSATEPAPIPSGAYPETCTDPTGAHVLSNPDGTFQLGVAPGDYYLVVQKGQFRRVRQITIPDVGPVELPADTTTLPNNMASAGDTIPNMAVMYAPPNGDQVDGVLQTLGITDFDLYNTTSGMNEPNTALLDNLSRMLEYHIIFFPCTIDGLGSQLNDPTGPLSDPAVLDNIRAYLSGGGKIYTTDMMYDVFEQPLPEYVDLCGDDSQINAADEEAWAHYETMSGWTSHGRAVDQDLAAWLDAIEGSGVVFDSQNLALEMNFVWIEDMYTEYEPIAGDPEPPHIWVEGDFILQTSQIKPLTITFPYGPGKVLFSTYHTVSSSSQQTLNGLIAQEWILVYLIMEIGVCSTPVL